jgi:two-component system, NtrC family, sensor kinase
MNQHLQNIKDLIDQNELIPVDQKNQIIESIKKVDKELEIVIFKLDRTEKVKKTTAILLEETIDELEQKRNAVIETNAALNKSMEELKATQKQLIHAEKMASLGELTAGIAHEIQNPLNFVNNFAEVSVELLEELIEELVVGSLQVADGSEQSGEGNLELVKEIAENIKQNLEKINHHGKRADAIVKGMLQHSRTSAGQKEPTDINALADEYLRLSYHGLRAKVKSFNADFKTDFDPDLPKIEVIPQDIGRVLLNLINNAFHAVHEKNLTGFKNLSGLKDQETYNPTVTITTKNLGNKIEIRVKDNGPGIPNGIRDKIFQPFFTTKPTGEGTGLGLSLSYDIITKGHGGEIKVETQQGKGSAFIILLPV